MNVVADAAHEQVDNAGCEHVDISQLQGPCTVRHTTAQVNSRLAFGYAV